jgi:hypothetical protein
MLKPQGQTAWPNGFHPGAAAHMRACCCSCMCAVMLTAATANAGSQLPAQMSAQKSNADMSRTRSCNSTAHALPCMLSPRQVVTAEQTQKPSKGAGCYVDGSSACSSCYMQTVHSTDGLACSVSCLLDARRSCASYVGLLIHRTANLRLNDDQRRGWDQAVLLSVIESNC